MANITDSSAALQSAISFPFPFYLALGGHHHHQGGRHHQQAFLSQSVCFQSVISSAMAMAMGILSFLFSTVRYQMFPE